MIRKTTNLEIKEILNKEEQKKEEKCTKKFRFVEEIEC